MYYYSSGRFTIMKKQFLLAFYLFIPFQVMAIDDDSVYGWGAWAKGVEPAAGPVHRVTPPPAIKPDINFRPNENSAFLREAASVNRPAFRPAPDAAIGAIQLPNIVITTSDTPTTSRDQF